MYGIGFGVEAGQVSVELARYARYSTAVSIRVWALVGSVGEVLTGELEQMLKVMYLRLGELGAPEDGYYAVSGTTRKFGPDSEAGVRAWIRRWEQANESADDLDDAPEPDDGPGYN